MNDWTRAIPAAPTATVSSLSDLSPQALDDLQRYVLQNLTLADTQGKISSSRIVGGVPGTELAYVEFTAGVSITGSEASPNNVVSSGAVNYDGTPIILEFFAPSGLTSTSSSSDLVCSLWESNTNLGRLTSTRTPVTAPTGPMLFGRRKITPVSGSATYRIRAWTTAGTGTINAGVGGGAGVYVPGYIRITKA